MLIAGVLCVCAAVISAALGLWSLSRPRSADTTQIAVRAVAPTLLAASVVLAAGGATALAAPAHSAVVLIVCVAGALGTVAAGSLNSARFAARREVDCGANCAFCTRACQSNLPGTPPALG